MAVKYLDLGRSYLRNKESYDKLVAEVWTSGRFFYGPAVVELEKNLAKFCGRKFAVTVGSCTDALYFALLAKKIGPGAEVIVTSFSHIASASSILKAGATPIFADIEPNNFMMSIPQLDQLVTQRTRAVLAVHMFGDCLNMEAIDAFAQKHNLLCIEDTAQSFGSSWKGRVAGSLGQLSCISFDPLKNLSSFASGGAVLTDSESEAEFFDRLSHHGRGRIASRDYDCLGFNSKIPTIDAAVLNLKFMNMASDLATRTRLASLYLSELQGIPQICLPHPSLHALHTWHKFTILCEDRDRLEAHLSKRQIETRRCWKLPLYSEGAVAKTAKSVAPLPGVEYVCDRVLCLPLYVDLREDELLEVTAAIREFYKGKI